MSSIRTACGRVVEASGGVGTDSILEIGDDLASMGDNVSTLVRREYREHAYCFMLLRWCLITYLRLTSNLLCSSG